MNITYLLLPLLFGLFSSFTSSAQAAETSFVPNTWYFESFHDQEMVFEDGVSVSRQISTFCKRYGVGGITDLTSLPEDQWNTALGHNLSVLSSSYQVDENQAQCSYYETETVETDTPKTVYLYIRQIQECGEDQEYSKDQHQCVAKAPQCTEGEQVLLSGYSAPQIWSDTMGGFITSAQTPETVCQNSCFYTRDSFSHSCYSDSPLSQSEIDQRSTTHYGHCNYYFTSTANACDQTSGSGLPGAWGGYSTTTASDGSMTCEPGIEAPGCPTTGDGSSGGGSGGGTGDGGTGGGTGDGGTGGGTGDGGTGGGTGDGGTGDGGTGGTDGTPSTVAGEPCDQTVSCSGDAIQCAILRQQKAQKCLIEDAYDFEKGLAKVEADIQSDEYTLTEETVDVTGLFSTGTRFLPAACPTPRELYIGTIGRSVSLSWEPLCQFADALSYIVVAMASLFFVVYVGRSFGGE